MQNTSHIDTMYSTNRNHHILLKPNAQKHIQNLIFVFLNLNVTWKYAT